MRNIDAQRVDAFRFVQNIYKQRCDFCSLIYSQISQSLAVRVGYEREKGRFDWNGVFFFHHPFLLVDLEYPSHVTQRLNRSSTSTLSISWSGGMPFVIECMCSSAASPPSQQVYNGLLAWYSYVLAHQLLCEKYRIQQYMMHPICGVAEIKAHGCYKKAISWTVIIETYMDLTIIPVDRFRSNTGFFGVCIHCDWWTPSTGTSLTTGSSLQFLHCIFDPSLGRLGSSVSRSSLSGRISLLRKTVAEVDSRWWDLPMWAKAMEQYKSGILKVHVITWRWALAATRVRLETSYKNWASDYI